jgi:DNA invertase Pin-like site-specific DNA recombinase
MTSVVLYLRVSSLEQSLDLQRKELEEYAKARGWEIEKIYEDKSTGTNTNRRALKELLQDCHRRQVKKVLIWKLDRLGRSLSDLISILRDWQELGIDLTSMRDSIDMSSSSGRLLTQLLMIFAEYEVSIIRERVRAGIAAAKARGKKFGRPPRLDHNRIVQLRLQGWSQGRIAKELGTNKGVVSKVLRRKGVQVVENSAPGRPRKNGGHS